MGLFRRLARLATITTLLGGTAAVAAAASPAASAAPAAGPVGWVRIAHLSPEAPAMDMYLYPFGNPASPVVLKDVSYGNVSNGTVRYWNRPNTQPASWWEQGARTLAGDRAAFWPARPARSGSPA